MIYRNIVGKFSWDLPLRKRKKKKIKKHLSMLPEKFQYLSFAQIGLYKLLSDFEFSSVLDIGAGSGDHANLMAAYGKHVTAIDFGVSKYAERRSDCNYELVIGDFMAYPFEKKFDCIWASHVLEHQPNVGKFIQRCLSLVKECGIIAVTVPPLNDRIVGGHLTLWNPGLLLYNFAFNGVDCRNASIKTYHYNITFIVNAKKRPSVHLDYDSGDINRLKEFLPEFCHEGFDGRIEEWNW